MPATKSKRLESPTVRAWAFTDAEARQFVRVCLKTAPALPDAVERAEFRDGRPEGNESMGMLLDLNPKIAAQSTERALTTNTPKHHAQAAWDHFWAACSARQQACQKWTTAEACAWLKRRAAFHLRASAHHNHFAICHGY